MATVTETPTAESTSDGRPTVGPGHHGLPMAYDEFIRADFQDGWLYELSRGFVIVTEVPGINHGRAVLRFVKLFVHYDDAHPGVINYQASGQDCRLRFPNMKSDRHPDQAVYLHPDPKGPRLWEHWMPDIAVEIVGDRGGERDYVLKREEYLIAGVREYWILDLKLRRMMVLVNRDGAWDQALLGENDTYRTELLPGLEVRVGELLGRPLADQDAAED